MNTTFFFLGLATATPTGVIPFRRVGQTGLEPITKSILTLKELPATVADVKMAKLLFALWSPSRFEKEKDEE